MNKWALDLTDEDIPIVNTKFKGERHNPNARASIININEKNFTPAALTYAFLKGMSNELKEFYDQIIKVTGRKKYLIGTGNGVRLNKAFQKIIKKDYDMPLFMPKHLEEAAYGAAILVASIFEGKSFKEYIEYKE
jgi:sugar (pentulose or hexulose) kinase